MVDDLFVGWEALYFFEGSLPGSRIGFIARSYSEAASDYEKHFGHKPEKLVGLEIT